jgi:hypothetical protein
MDVRADWALEQQLERVEEHAVDQHVKEWIRQAIAHMGRAGRGNRRGGAELVALLAEARQRAADYDEWHVVRLLQDSIDYAQGRILRPAMEEQYRLYQDGLRSETKREFVAAMVSNSLRFAAELANEYLAQHPRATLPELFTHFESLGQDAAFLEAPEDRPGRYRIPRGRAEHVIWIERVLRDRIDVEDTREEARRLAMSPKDLAALAADADGQTILRAVELQHRAAGLAVLRRVVDDPHATEHQLQKAISGHYWIRGTWVVASAINDAVSQAVAYLVGLDEHRLRIRKDIGIETRRASAIVLIGHPAAQPDVPEEAIYETIRTLNTHLVRVEVLTYKELVDNAERSIGGAIRTI